jgi:hypothetical protein
MHYTEITNFIIILHSFEEKACTQMEGRTSTTAIHFMFISRNISIHILASGDKMKLLKRCTRMSCAPHMNIHFRSSCKPGTCYSQTEYPFNR